MTSGPQLVQFETIDGLRLTGLLSGKQHSKTVIHIHGKCGNFYDNKFLKEMYHSYSEFGVNLLGFNNRGAACLNETPTSSGAYIYTGTATEKIEDCVYDIDAAVNFCRDFSQEIYIQGHSFGCEKAIYYLSNAKEDTVRDIGCILLSPTDGYALHRVFLETETVEQQYERLDSSRDTSGEVKILPRREYGIRNGSTDYFVPITADALCDLIAGPAFSLFRLDREPDWRIQNRTICYLGGNDDLQIDHPNDLWRRLAKSLPNGKLLWRENGQHDLRPNISTVIDDLVSWIG